MLRIGILAAVTLLAAATCSPAPAADVIRVAMYPTTDMLPIYVMEAEGIAARHGFRIEESEPYAGGLAVLDAIVAGDADLSYPGMVPVLAHASQGHVPGSVVIVGLNTLVTPNAPSAALFVGAGVDDWGDLAGRQIGTHNVTSINAASFAARAKAEGLDQYEFVIVSLIDMGLAVRDGTVAAAVMEEPWTTQAVLRGDGHVLAYTQGEPPLELVPLTAIAVSPALAANSDLLKRFLRAHLEAVRLIQEDPERVRNLFVPKAAISAEVAQQMRLKEFPLDARLDIADVQALQVLLAAGGTPASPIDPVTFYAPEALEAVLAEGP